VRIQAPCPLHEYRAMMHAECTCNPGYERRDGACSKCPTGTAKSRQGDAPCEACFDHKHAPRTGLDRCLDKACLCEEM